MICSVSAEEIQCLCSKDKKLKELIERVGQIEYEINPDVYSAFVSSIISQQISGKAADSIEKRLYSLLGEVTPKKVLGAAPSTLRQAGLSQRKCEYIINAAQKSVSGEIDFDALHKMPDREVIEELVKLKGAGVWTAQMLMIFSLGRKNILSFNDLGIRRGIMRLYGLKELDFEKFQKYEKRYSPYCTAASLYLWRS